MPASKQISINLIGQEEMGHTPIGRIVTWAVTYGRYIMIGTEIVVLLAFISRFSLDRKLTDLKDEISQKQAIIEANVDFEKDFRSLQGQLTKIKSLVAATPTTTLDVLNDIVTVLPTDVYLNSLDIDKDSVKASVVASSTVGFSQLINNLQASRQFAQVEIGDINRDPLKGIEFSFTATLVPTNAEKKVATSR